MTVTGALRCCGVDVLERQLSAPDGAAVALVVPDGAVRTVRRANHAAAYAISCRLVAIRLLFGFIVTAVLS